MTDKVQKIREEVERLKRWNNNVRNSTRHMTLQEEDFNRGKHSSYLEILNFIDSLQEEPVSNPTPNKKMSVERWKRACEAACCDTNYRSYYGLTETRDDYFVDGVQWADEHPKEEPVSEDLGEIVLEGTNFNKSWYAHPELAFKAGSEWQKEQFEKNRLKHCNSITNEQAELEQGFIDQHIDKYNRMPTFLDAIEYGKKNAEEQLMKGATEVTVHEDAGGYPYIPQIELYDYDKDIPLAKEGDRYKVILIKEE